MLAVVVFGASGAVAANFEAEAWIFAAIAGVAGALDSVFRFSHRAKDHAVLKAKFAELLSEVGAASSIEALEALSRKKDQIDATEPPVYEAAYAVAYNRSLVTRGQSEHAVPVGLAYRLTKNLIRFNGKIFGEPSATK